MYRHLPLYLLNLLSALVPAASAHAQPAAIGAVMMGTWLNPGGSVAVRTGACDGGRLCGWVVWADAHARADAQRGAGAALVGTRLLEDYAPAGRGRWNGTVFVPDMGRRFASTIVADGPDRMTVRGCLLGGFLCRSQIWTRIERLPVP